MKWIRVLIIVGVALSLIACEKAPGPGVGVASAKEIAMLFDPHHEVGEPFYLDQALQLLGARVGIHNISERSGGSDARESWRDYEILSGSFKFVGSFVGRLHVADGVGRFVVRSFHIYDAERGKELASWNAR
jgi:hypothetical protein